MSNKRVTAIIVTYQSARTIGAALAAARRCHDAGLLDLVVVDNASRDATREILAREAGWARVVLSDRNNGFGRGCNLGFEHVASPYTLFLNPDAVVEPDCLRGLMMFLEQHPKAGIVGPATLVGGRSDLHQPTGPYPTPWSTVRDATPLLRRSTAVPIAPGSAPMRTGWVCGAILMIRTALVRELRGFDPRFFLYWEEVDLCRRAEYAGYENWVLGTAVAQHVVGASSGDVPRFGTAVAKHYYQSRYYYMAKHHGWLAATAAEVCEFVLLSLDALRGRGRERLRPRLQAALLSLPDER